MIPLANQFGWDILDMVLHGGEDYELLMAIAPGHDDDMARVAQEVEVARIYRIGRLVEGSGITLQRADGTMGNALQVPWADYQAWLADSKTHPEIPAGSIPAKYAQDIGLTCDNLPGYTDSGKKVDEQGTLPNDQTGPLEGAIYPYWVKA